jgi:hypothetical protein
MSRYLIVLGLLSLVVVAMGCVSVITGSWSWSATTMNCILIWRACRGSSEMDPSP